MSSIKPAFSMLVALPFSVMFAVVMAETVMVEGARTHHGRGNLTMMRRNNKTRTKRLPFAQAYFLTVDPTKALTMQARLKSEGVANAVSHFGYDGRTKKGEAAALSYLQKLGYTKRLHPSFSIPFACMHTSPNNPPHIGVSLSELWGNLWHDSSTLEEMLENDKHNCVAKVVGVAAGHASIWKSIAERKEDEKDKDGWYLILEDDVSFCPGWLQRLEKELPNAPSDADALKLSFFGHWRAEDAVGYDPSQAGNASAPFSSFLEARRPMDSKELVGACLKELLSGNGWSSVPCAGFYAGNQAYMITKKSAKKMLSLLQSQPFQDIDMTMMEATKTYAFRHVLAKEAVDDFPRDHAQGDDSSFLQVGNGMDLRGKSASMGVPQCNSEPPGR